MNGAEIGKDKNRLWCILQDDKLFYMGGCKALNMTSDNAGLAHCMKSSENGKIKLSYDISEYSPMSERVERLSAEDIIAVVKSLTRSVMTVSNNGMMSLQSTVFDMDKVFVSGSSNRGFKTLMIYLPLAVEPSAGGDDGSENYFRFVRELLRSAGQASADPAIRPLVEALDHNRHSLEGFHDELDSISAGSASSGGEYGGGQVVSGASDSLTGTGTGPGYGTSGTSVGGGQAVSGGASSGGAVQYGGAPSGGKAKLGGKTLAILVAQICAVALGIVAFVLVGPLAVAAVLFADAIAVVLIFTLGGMRQRRPKAKPVFEAGGSAGPVSGGSPDDTEEFTDFTPSVRLVGQNTPMMLKFVIEKAEFSIGRSADCDAVLPDTLKAISGHHCRIVTEKNVMYVMDDYAGSKRVGSKNGTYINGSGNRIEPKQKARLQINDTLQLANYRFKVEHL